MVQNTFIYWSYDVFSVCLRQLKRSSQMRLLTTTLRRSAPTLTTTKSRVSFDSVTSPASTTQSRRQPSGLSPTPGKSALRLVSCSKCSEGVDVGDTYFGKTCATSDIDDNMQDVHSKISFARNLILERASTLTTFRFFILAAQISVVIHLQKKSCSSYYCFCQSLRVMPSIVHTEHLWYWFTWRAISKSRRVKLKSPLQSLISVKKQHWNSKL